MPSEHDAAQLARARAGDREGVALQHVDGAVALVIAHDQAAHAVRDDVHAQLRVAVVAPDLLDQGIERAHRHEVVLAPVVGEGVEARFVTDDRLPGMSAPVAADLLQGGDDLAVEVEAGGGVEQSGGDEPVVLRLEGLGVDAKRKVQVAAGQQLSRAAGPDLHAGLPVGQPRTHQPRDDDHGYLLPFRGPLGGLAREFGRRLRRAAAEGQREQQEYGRCGARAHRYSFIPA